MRNSNLELLRIVAIFFVIFHHLLIKGADTCGYVTPYAYNGFIDLIGPFFNSLAIIGVNLFVLISGYFGIRHLKKGAFRLVTDCIIYGLISLGIALLLGAKYSNSLLYGSCCFTRNWYVLHYLFLLLISPIIEQSLVNVSQKKLGYWVCLLTIVNIWGGYFLESVNDNGYNFVNFVYLYYIGRYIRMALDSSFWHKISKYGIWIWFISSLVLTGGFVLLAVMGKDIESIRYWGYNNPLVIVSSIAFFCYFCRLRFQNRWINIVAAGVFGTYLLHTTVAIRPIRDKFASLIYGEYSYAGLMILSIMILIISILFSLGVLKLNEKIKNKALLCSK